MSNIYVCEKCGTAVDIIYKGGAIPQCCGEEMKPAEVKTEDYVKEKHVPYIVYIEICADGVLMRKYLKPGDAPEAFFATDAKEIRAWEFCNKHGLWKSNQ